MAVGGNHLPWQFCIFSLCVVVGRVLPANNFCFLNRARPTNRLGQPWWLLLVLLLLQMTRITVPVCVLLDLPVRIAQQQQRSQLFPPRPSFGSFSSYFFVRVESLVFLSLPFSPMPPSGRPCCRTRVVTSHRRHRCFPFRSPPDVVLAIPRGATAFSFVPLVALLFLFWHSGGIPAEDRARRRRRLPLELLCCCRRRR